MAAARLSEEQVKIERLRQDHLPFLASFDCGKKAETDFLNMHAWPNQCRKLSETYLLFEKGRKEIVSYITLTFGSFKLAGDRKIGGLKTKKKPFRVYTNNLPCLLIAKLGTDKEQTGRGGASLLLAHAIQKAVEIDKVLALPFLALDAYNERTGFYLERGFKIAYKPRKNDKTTTLYLELFI